ncbi:hypothetical protein AB0L63_02945 [Nocardia sp. NPDC051990]|uniref:hypothetical protein n=1 Tax=Nocardia sp. NPDC051990 TaxID=3155285 RepID=UPI00341B1D2C
MTRDRLRTSQSPDGRLVAQWHLDGTIARIHQVQNHADARRGLVVFDTAKLPDLADARAALPSYEALWDTIRHERLSAIFSVAEIPTGTA